MSKKVIRPDKRPKPRIDPRGPKYPPAPFVCPAVLVAQALPADNREHLAVPLARLLGRREAEERSKELNAAYGYLKERYGG